MSKIFKLIFLFLISGNIFAESIYLSNSKNIYRVNLPDKLVKYSDEKTQNEKDSYSYDFKVFPISDLQRYGLGKYFYMSDFYIKNRNQLSFEKISEGLKKNISLLDNPNVYDYWEKKIYDDFLIFSIYQNFTEGDMLNSIGMYNVFIIDKENVYYFSLYSNRALSDFSHLLTKYINPTKQQRSLFEYENKIYGFPYAVLNAPMIFYNDIRNKDEGLPDYIRNFYSVYETFLSKIVKAFTHDKYIVSSNLRIRKSPKTGESIITVRQGSQVQILEIGKEDFIDKINGCWVKVLVSEGTKDKDGNEITEEITGWCFDGYLETE